jgi:outer membrane protein assembly factor BamB
MQEQMRRARRAGAVTAVAVGLAAAAAAQQAARADWPQWRGPNRDAISKDTGLLKEWKAGGPPLAWQASGLGTGFSSLSMANGRLFTMGDVDGAQHVIALDQASGKPLWKARVGGVHQADYAGPRGTPTTDGELLYAVGTDGDLVCLETATGKERWRRHLERDFGGRMMSGWRFSESPLVDGERVLVTPGASDAAIVALDKKTGKEIWRAAVPVLGPKGRDGAAYSSIVVSEGAGVKQYVQLLGKGVVGIRASDGKFLWGNNSVANGTANISTPVIKGDYVFASTGYQTGSVLLKLLKHGDGVAATEVYFLDSKTFQNHHGGFVLVGGHLYGGHGHRAGFPIAVEFATGRIAWGGDIRNEGRGSAAVAYADGHVYLRYEDGTVILIEATPAGYKPKGSFTIPNVTRPSWPHPVVAGGRLYLREQDNLYVYDVRG